MFTTNRDINTTKKQSFISSGMKFIQGQNRQQTYLFPVSLDDAVDPENEVRLIDVFVDSLNLEEFGLKRVLLKTCLTGRQAGDLPTIRPIY